MSRPEIPEQNYIEEIDRMIADGVTITDIKAATLQKAVGGRYARCAKVLETYRKDHKESTDEALRATMPAWFSEVKGKAVGDLNTALDSVWFAINREINAAVETAASAYQLKKQEIERAADEQLSAIDQLEARTEELEELLEESEGKLERGREEYKKQFKQFSKMESDHKAAVATLTERAEGLARTNKELAAKYATLENQLLALAQGKKPRG